VLSTSVSDSFSTKPRALGRQARDGADASTRKSDYWLCPVAIARSSHEVDVGARHGSRVVHRHGAVVVRPVRVPADRVLARRLAHTLFTDYEQGGIRLGSSSTGCFGPNEVSGFVDGGGYPVRLRLHDAAGNIGEWQSFAFTATAEQPGGCGTPSGTAGTGTTDPNADGGAAAGGRATAGNSAAGNAAASSQTSKSCTLSLGTPRGSSSLATLLALGTCALLARRRSLAIDESIERRRA
jgi:hypothetical protein